MKQKQYFEMDYHFIAKAAFSGKNPYIPKHIYIIKSLSLSLSLSLSFCLSVCLSLSLSLSFSLSLSVSLSLSLSPSLSFSLSLSLSLSLSYSKNVKVDQNIGRFQHPQHPNRFRWMLRWTLHLSAFYDESQSTLQLIRFLPSSCLQSIFIPLVFYK